MPNLGGGKHLTLPILSTTPNYTQTIIVKCFYTKMVCIYLFVFLGVKVVFELSV